MDKIQPWCISRQLWRWHRIPVMVWIWWSDGYRGWRHCFSHRVPINPIFWLWSCLILIADSRLSEQFTLDEFIELMLSDSIVPTEGKIYEVYNTIYWVKFAGDKAMLEQLSNVESFVFNLKSWSKQHWLLFIRSESYSRQPLIIIDAGQTFLPQYWCDHRPHRSNTGSRCAWYLVSHHDYGQWRH